MPAKRASTRAGAATRRAPKASAARTKAPTSRICSRCGRTSHCGPGGIPAGWSVGFDRGRTEFLCVDCARANIRAIEGKLPEEYWE